VGLVAQLLHRVPWFQVQELQKMYSAIPITMVASELQRPTEQTHAYLEDLIAKGRINAVIEYPQNGEIILRFYPNFSSGPLAKTEQQHHQAIVRQKKRIDKLSDEVKFADARMSVTRYWVDHLRKKNQKGEDGVLERDQTEPMPFSADGNEDEDLMEAMDMA
jgi:COP9 signalosome complex subunit 3